MGMRIRDNYLEGLDLSSVRAFINCSEPVRADSHQVFYERYAPYGLKESTLTTCYAMAENVFAVTQGGVEESLKIDVIDRNDFQENNLATPFRK